MSFLVILVSGMLLIVLSADYFTNGIEWLGHHLGLGEGVVGSLLAALGTALPETLVPIMAILFGHPGEGSGIGLGAILGAPFMLSTLGFFVIGLGLWFSGRRREGLKISRRTMTGDLRFFLGAFGLAIVSAFLPKSVHPVLAVILVLAYIVHAVRLVRFGASEGRGGDQEVLPQPLHLYHAPRPPLAAVLLQVALALFGLVVGAHFFVEALDRVTGTVALSGFLVSVIVTPVATELPEVLNSIIWIRRRRDGLAIGNVTGAMAFQASLVPALGIWLTPWHFNPWELATAVLAWAAALWILLRSQDGTLGLSELLTAGLFYLAFIGLVVAIA